MKGRFTVALDGPAAAGKGTIARALADHFGLAYLDTGLLYRAVGKRTLSGEDALTAAQGLTPKDLAAEDLRTSEIAQAASVAAAIPEVREALVAFQREFAAQEGGAILDGRDIGTVICPEADAKLFVTASDSVRAERRFLELSAKGGTQTRDEVLAALHARDARDAEREAAPMVAADDAVMIDTSDMTIAEAVQVAKQHVSASIRR
ncbi:(d)CMP kinase [Shimia ponticola]|uniref:(d)CMP kinase n=1 Tax=Shimia ponticola TaxID=2582893 RepID=UPI0011BE8016|nr:d(CMP) kinase [Shimia ponticola]